VVVWASAAYLSGTGQYQLGVFGRRFGVCGNGLLGALACDDGNATSLDGCSSRCQVETCQDCTGEPSACAPFPGCTAVCGDAASMVSTTFLSFRGLGAPVGDEGLTFKGAITGSALAPGAYDPTVDGAEVVLTGPGLVWGLMAPLAVPPGLLGSGCGPFDGWQKRVRGTTFTYKYLNASGALPPGCAPGSANGLRSMRLKDRLATTGRIEFRVKTRDSTIPTLPVAPVTATLVLGQSPAAGTAGRCARILLTGSTGGTRFFP
jgi:cysteine-rich repeat protein